MCTFGPPGPVQARKGPTCLILGRPGLVLISGRPHGPARIELNVPSFKRAARKPKMARNTHLGLKIVGAGAAPVALAQGRPRLRSAVALGRSSRPQGRRDAEAAPVALAQGRSRGFGDRLTGCARARLDALVALALALASA